jgi:cation diffusion facilitator CzcD-associated flavoprotein CzcO
MLGLRAADLELLVTSEPHASIISPPTPLPRGTRRRPRIVVIGAGPGGIAAAVRLRQAGYDDVVVLEKARGIGGTWWHNRYPGAACDVKSFLYSFSFELKRDWSRPYSTQPEILAYLDAIVARHDLGRSIRLGTAVTDARWDETAGRWRVATQAGETITADVVVSALGMFNDLNWPAIPGLDDFRGALFHSARWDDAHDLTGRRVAVIGSAASAVQLVPEIAPRVAQLHVFQRSAQWVLPKDDDPYTDEQIARHVAEPELVAAARREIWDRVEATITFSNPRMLQAATDAGLKAIAAVRDPATRRKLTPTVPYGSHRPLIANGWYPTFNRPNVELVTDPIVRIGHTGITTLDGVERPVDTIVLATGFQTTRFLSAIPVVGRDERTLAHDWRDGAQAYLGIANAGFPNLFMLYGPNTNNGSILYMLECQLDYVVRLLQRMERDGLARAEVTDAAQRAYNARLRTEIDAVEVWRSHLTRGYYRGPAGTIVTQWPHNMGAYRSATTVDDRRAWSFTAA